MSDYDPLISYMVQHKICTPEQIREVQISAQKKRGSFLHGYRKLIEKFTTCHKLCCANWMLDVN